MSLEGCIQYECDLQIVSFGSQDVVEDREAFEQKRDPELTGC